MLRVVLKQLCCDVNRKLLELLHDIDVRDFLKANGAAVDVEKKAFL